MDNSKTRILVTDDEYDFRQLMVVWLESKGYRVTAVSDGKSAVKAVKEDPPDIVFLDLNMPVMDGVETLKRIREFNKDIPVIIISAYLDRLRLTEVKPYNVSGVFYKGEDFEKGLSLLESTLRTHKRLKK